MKAIISVSILLIIFQYSFSQETKKHTFIGIQPSFTKEKFYDKNEFDINLIPFVLQHPLSRRMDFRLTTLANYHFGNNNQFSDLGGEFAAPIFIQKKDDTSEKSKGFFLSPIVGPSRNVLDNHYTITLATEGGYFFLLGEKFALSTQLQFGGSFFLYDQKDNEWVQHFGLKVNLGFWL